MAERISSHRATVVPTFPKKFFLLKIVLEVLKGMSLYHTTPIPHLYPLKINFFRFFFCQGFFKNTMLVSPFEGLIATHWTLQLKPRKIRLSFYFYGFISRDFQVKQWTTSPKYVITVSDDHIPGGIFSFMRNNRD